MRWEQPVQYASMTDVGLRRRNNQDSSAVQICSDRQTWADYGHLFLVADGMGGHAVGELASKIAADTLPHTFFKSRGLPVTEALKQAIEAANGAIYERGSHNRDFERMGTTCSALVLGPQGAVIGHVGDSRVYRIRGDRIDQLTFDHSLQWELLRQGKMKPEEVFLHGPRHVITRSLGPDAAVKIDCEGPYPALPGDTYLLCSDGLTTHVSDAEIGAIAGELPPGDACRLLVHLANLRGGSDNITVVIARVGSLPEGIADDEIGTRPSPSDEGPGWCWLAGFWASAIAFAGGISAALLGRPLTGLAAGAVALTAVAALAVAWWKQRPAPPQDDDPARTVLWRPYRSAPAVLTRQFLGQLASMEAELQRTAAEEGWTIDRQAHESSYRAAKSAAMAGRYGEALCEYARSIDVLMAGLHHQRRHVKPRDGKRQEPVAGKEPAARHADPPGGAAPESRSRAQAPKS